MNKLILLFGVLICLVAVHARHYREKNEPDSLEEEDALRSKERVSRHRRRRWQSNYGYDYTPPSYYYPDRRDDRNNQEVLQNIYRLLDEIATNLRRTPPPPPPPPQPIYIPYPVSFPTQVVCKTQPNARKNSSEPTPDKRFPDMEDTNQNWGLVPAPEEHEDYDDGARPISFQPLVPKQIMKRPSPKVEHGSEQVAFSTDAPKFERDSPSAIRLASQSSPLSSAFPRSCNAAILSCCSFSDNMMQRKQCFASMDCSTTYADGKACSPESIQKTLDSITAAYAPV